MLYNCYAEIRGQKFVGQVEADSPCMAEVKAAELSKRPVLCSDCLNEIESPEVVQIDVFPYNQEVSSL